MLKRFASAAVCFLFLVTPVLASAQVVIPRLPANATVADLELYVKLLSQVLALLQAQWKQVYSNTAFAASPTKGQPPLAVIFSGTLKAAGYSIDFGDGTTSGDIGCAHGGCPETPKTTKVNTTHTYTTEGVYIAKLRQHFTATAGNCAGVDCNVVGTATVTVGDVTQSSFTFVTPTAATSVALEGNLPISWTMRNPRGYIYFQLISADSGANVGGLGASIFNASANDTYTWRVPRITDDTKETLRAGRYKILATVRSGERASDVYTVAESPVFTVTGDSVSNTSPAPACTVSFNPSTIATNATSSLRIIWTSRYATSHSISQMLDTKNNTVSMPAGNIGLNGLLSNFAFSTLLPDTYTRTDTVTGPGGTNSCSATLKITAATSTPASCPVYQQPLCATGSHVVAGTQLANGCSSAPQCVADVGTCTYGYVGERSATVADVAACRTWCLTGQEGKGWPPYYDKLEGRCVFRDANGTSQVLI